MYNKHFFEASDISTVRNNYIISRTRIRYYHYLNKIHTYIATCDNSNAAKQEVPKYVLEATEIDHKLMDESLHIDMFSIMMKSFFGDSINTTFERFFWETAESAAKMEFLEKKECDNRIIPNEILTSKYADKIPSIVLSSTLTDYDKIKFEIRDYLADFFNGMAIEVPLYTGNSIKYFKITDNDEIIEAFLLDIMALICSLSCSENIKNMKSRIASEILANIEEVEPQISSLTSQENLRKKISHFFKEGISNLFCPSYLSKRQDDFLIYSDFEALFLYFLFNGDIELIESDVSRDYEIKKSFQEKIEKMCELTEKYPVLKYHIEQHFLMYSHSSMDRLAEADDIQATFIMSALYDIPFPLTRIELSKIISGFSDIPMSIKDVISLIDLKYMLYSISKIVFDKINNMIELNQSKKKIILASMSSQMLEDISDYMKDTKIPELSGWFIDICTAMGYNQNSKKIMHTETEYYETLKKIAKSK